MCIVMSITGADFATCNGIYALEDGMVHYDRPIYRRDAYRVLYYDTQLWVSEVVVNLYKIVKRN